MRCDCVNCQAALLIEAPIFSDCKYLFPLFNTQTKYVSAALTPLNSLTHDVARRLGKLGSVALWMDGRQVRSHVTVQVQRYTCNL